MRATVRPASCFERFNAKAMAESYATVARYARRVRQAQGLKPRQPLPRQRLPTVTEPRQRPLTTRRVTGLVQPGQFDDWLVRVSQSASPALRRFAKGLHDDYAAVQAGLTLPWSNGPVEGQINRLKMLKRSMYGRAGLDLLSRRFLLAA